MVDNEINKNDVSESKNEEVIQSDDNILDKNLSDVEDSNADDSNNEDESDHEDEKLTLTKKELDARAAKIREITARNERRKSDARLQDEINKIKSEYESKQVNSNDSNVWDPTLNRWISKDTTISQYAQMLENPGINIPTSVVKDKVVKQDNRASHEMRFSDDAEDQAIQCSVDYDDFEDVLRNSPLNPIMANAAAKDPNGIENIYKTVKNDPVRLYKISQLKDPDDQRLAIFRLNEEVRLNRRKKIQTKATPQPKSISSSGTIAKSESKMTISELRELYK